MLQSQHEWIRNVVLALDLGGAFVFALSGAGTGVKHRLDLFGVLVLSFAAATARATIFIASIASCARTIGSRR
jgi:uncharacterized membrane protein YeiH